jgi:hypothetical protein
MKSTSILSIAVCSVALICAPIANAEELNNTIRELEMRINALESVDYHESNDSDYDSYGTCVDSANWLSPSCPLVELDAEFLLLRASDSEAEVNDGTDNFNAGVRLTYSRVNQSGQIIRLRYFNLNSPLTGGTNRYEMNEVDAEIGRRFTLGGGLQGEFTAGVRWASFEEINALDYDNSLGALVGIQLRGREFLNGTSFVNLRHSWQFGNASDSGAPSLPGTFNISELQFGLEWQRSTRFGELVFRPAFESQYWSGVQDSDTEDIGLYGASLGFGLIR